jgi:hypothetical protein
MHAFSRERTARLTNHNAIVRDCLIFTSTFSVQIGSREVFAPRVPKLTRRRNIMHNGIESILLFLVATSHIHCAIDIGMVVVSRELGAEDCARVDLVASQIIDLKYYYNMI